MDLFEVMGTARAMRWFKPDPVPDELVEQMLWGATRASNPNNVQAWDFVVVRDAQVRKRLGEALAPGADYVRSMPDSGEQSTRRTLSGALNLIENFAEITAVIFICGRNIFPAEAPAEPMMYSAMYSAAQNLVLAGRALGLGVAYTAMHNYNEPGVRAILGIPDDRHIGVTMPIGYPARNFGPVKRRPLAEVVHHDRW
jgi:nitroreductase